MHIKFLYNWDPANEFMKVAEETINNNSNEDKGKNAIAILLMAAAIEAKAKEPFNEMMPENLQLISRLDFQNQLLYTLWKMEEKNEYPLNKKFEKYNIKLNPNEVFNNYRISIKNLMLLRNQIAHGKTIKSRTKIGLTTENIKVSNEYINTNKEFEDIKEYIKKIPINQQITQDPILMFEFYTGNLFFRNYVAEHFLSEALSFMNYIEDNKHKWVTGFHSPYLGVLK